MAVVDVAPRSRGSVTLASNDPFEFPIINPNFLSADDDVAVMVQAIKDAQEIVSNTQFDGYIISQLDPSPNATDSELADFARQGTASVYHPAGTARMGSGNGSYVTTPELLVRGTVGLRVVDASVLVSIVIFSYAYLCHTLLTHKCLFSLSFLLLTWRPLCTRWRSARRT